MTCRIRLAHLQLLPLVSGVQTVTLEEFRLIDRSRFEPTIICQEPGPLSEKAGEIGVPCIFLPELARAISPINDARALLHLRRVMLEQRFEILHTHSSKTGILGRLAGRWAGVPVVMHTVHGYAFPAARKALLRVLYKSVEWGGARTCDAMICLNQSDMDIARHTLGVPAAKLFLVPNGIDTGRFFPRAAAERQRLRAIHLGISEGTITIGMVGRLWRQKNPLCLLEAIPKLLTSTSMPVQVFFIGDGELRAEMEEQINQAGLENVVTILGWRNDVSEVLPALDICVLPSLWEGQPLALLEAMACGVAAIASDIPGNRDTLEHLKTGLLVRPDDADALAAALQILVEDASMRQRLGAAARMKVEAFHRLQERVSFMESLYKELLARKEQARGSAAD